MLKASQLSSDGRNHLIPRTVVSRMINHTFWPRLSTFDNEDLRLPLEEHPLIVGRLFESRVPSDYALSHLHQMDSIVHKKQKQVDRRGQVKICPFNCWKNSHWMIGCWKRLVTFGREIVSLLAQLSQLAEAMNSVRDEDLPSVVR